MKRGFLTLSLFTLLATASAVGTSFYQKLSKTESMELPTRMASLAIANVSQLKTISSSKTEETKNNQLALSFEIITEDPSIGSESEKVIQITPEIKNKLAEEIKFATVEKKPIILEEVSFEDAEYSNVNVEEEILTASETEAQKEDFEINVDKRIVANPVKLEVEYKKESLVALFKPIKPEAIAKVEEVLLASNTKSKENEQTLDRISTAQAAPEKSNNENKTSNTVKSEEKILPQKVAQDFEPDASDYSGNVVAQKNLPVVSVESAKEQIAEVSKPEARVTKAEPVETKPEKTISPKQNDELVFFDYAKKEEPKQELPKWEEVKKALKKTAKKAQAVAVHNAKKSAPKNVTDPKPAQDDYSSFVGTPNKKSQPFEYSFEVAKVEANRKTKKLTSFEFDFKDDYNDRVRSDSTGKLVLKGRLKHTSLRRFSVYGRDIYPTVVDQVFVPGKQKLVIPAFSNEFMSSIFKQKELKGLGGHIFIELDSLTEDVELDRDTYYEQKIFLDAKFQIVDRQDSDFDYIMFVGVAPGNTIINFKTYKNEVTTKIIHVTNSEVFYDSNYYRESKKEEFKLYEEHILSKNILPLDITTKKISQFSQTENAIKKSMGEYYLAKMTYPEGTRKYMELSHLRESIFVGYSDNKNIIVPSENYKWIVFDKFGINNLNNQCIVQLNLNAKAREISVEGQSNSGAMRIQSMMLDEDGVFYDDFTASTKKVFIRGEEQGIINIKIKYNDNTTGYIQSYCSNATYLVEQL